MLQVSTQGLCHQYCVGFSVTCIVLCWYFSNFTLSSVNAIELAGSYFNEMSSASMGLHVDQGLFSMGGICSVW